MAIASPRTALDHNDRPTECVAALEPAFQDVEAAAIAAGWTPDEVAVALMDLAKNSLLSLAEMRRTQASVDVAKLLARLRDQSS